jgi:hypothetical protein
VSGSGVFGRGAVRRGGLGLMEYGSVWSVRCVMVWRSRCGATGLGMPRSGKVRRSINS